MSRFHPKIGNMVSTDVYGVKVDRGYIAHFQVSAVAATAADTDGIHAAIIDTGVQQVVTTDITNPSVPRNITATAGGTAADIGAIQVTIEGTNYNNEVITETLPVFTVNTSGTVIGSKAFKMVTKITIPAHNGTGATTAVGFDEKLGLPYKLFHNTIFMAYLNNVKEDTMPVVVVNAAALESNTVDLNSALDGHVVDVYLVV